MRQTRFLPPGAAESVRFGIGECSLGSMLVAPSEWGICAISLGDDPDALVLELQARFPRAQLSQHEHDFASLITQVARLVETPSMGLDLALDVRGTAFQRWGWQALREIPEGSTASYGEIAEWISAPQKAYAVGHACASNVIAVAIPCHRVVRKNGALAGYRWGVERKRALLEREARA